jgi:transcriptional regulator GlxA family with amidase domain
VSDYTATYLNDHLAGSVAALDLLVHLTQQHAGTELEEFFDTLRADILEDRDELAALMERLGVSSSRVRKAVAWVAEKFARL